MIALHKTLILALRPWVTALALAGTAGAALADSQAWNNKS